MLRLRPYKPCDAKTIVSWVKDEVTYHEWCVDKFRCFPLTADAMNAHYDSFANTDDFFEMTAFDETGVTGHLIMRFTDEEKRNLRFGFVIVDDRKKGQGYGKAMLRLAIKYAFDILKVEMISLGVFVQNESAYYCYRSVGFQDTGEIIHYSFNGEEWICKELKLTGPSYRH